jgi:fermentation-respiration switch protein FrsA (DUF1100 family)
MRCDLPLETAEALIEYRPEALVQRISPRPLLLIHGENDMLVPVEESQALFKRAGAPRQLEVATGMDHFDWVMPQSLGFKRVTASLVSFLQEFLPAK